MTNNGIAVKYGDVALEAKENFEPTASESQFDTLAQLQRYNLNFPNYANPCELYSVVLDGTATALPSMPDDYNLGLWSTQVSGFDGVFRKPIELELTSEGLYSSIGLTFTFDTHNNIYPTQINIRWYRDGKMLDNKDFTPTSAFYFCNNSVENYNKIIITFYAINMPKNRLKLCVVDYGYGTYFYRTELRNVNIIQELDPISSQISINTADLTLDSKSNIEYSFRAKQPLSIYYNGELKSTTFVKTARRTSRSIWEITSEDYIGVMDSIQFYGGLYADKNAIELLTEIFAKAKVPFEIDKRFNCNVSGYIPYTTCREALMQVAFAIQAVVDTSDSDVVKVYALTDDIKQTIPRNRIKQGQNFVDDTTVTGVEVWMHSYRKTRTVTTAYDASESGVGEEIFVTFAEPLHSLKIGYLDGDDYGDFVEDDSAGDILESGVNYAIINAKQSNCVLQGNTYEHITQTRRKNPDIIGANAIENVITIENATMITADNIQNVLENCFDWLSKTKTVNLEIIEGKHVEANGKIKYGQRKYGTFKYGEAVASSVVYDKPVNIGEIINAETEYLGIVGGRMISQSYNLNGNGIVKRAVLK